MTETRRVALLLGLGAFLLAASPAATLINGDWTFSAIALGLVFGLILHKGDLCFAAACSEAVIMRDAGKLFAFWLCIVVSMAGFGLLDVAGLVTLDPLDACWAANLTGGLLFGCGMTLAGGCVAGSLYKSASGNVNSMAALVGIPLGALAVRHGPLRPIRESMEKLVWKAPGGGALTLPSMTGLAPWQLAIGFVLATLAVVWWWRRRDDRNRSRDRGRRVSGGSLGGRVLRRPWRPWQAGLALGLLACISYPSSEASGRHYPLGVTYGVMQTEQLLIDAASWSHSPAPGRLSIDRPEDTVVRANPSREAIVWWEVLLVLGLFVGAWISARLSGDVLLPRPPEQTIVAFLGGLLTGLGATLGLGCSIGHIVSGWALMSVGSFIFGLAAVLSGWATTCAYLVGGIPWGFGRKASQE